MPGPDQVRRRCHQGRSRLRGRAACLVLAALAGTVHAQLAPVQLGAEEQALLARTNLFSSVPERFHATLLVSRPDWLRPLRVEMWRGGRDRMLARVLDPRQAGRFLLQLGADHFLVAPGARQPVKLAAGVAAAGPVSFEQMLGVDVERDFDVERVEAGERMVTFHLVARVGGAAARATPRARWVVDRTRRQPVRLDVVLADGRTSRVVEFVSFSDPRALVPSRLVLKDILRGGPPVSVELERFEAAAVSDDLFSLTDGAGRSLLPPAPPPR
ncbi:MAG: hypothetical protein AB2L07_06830 [Thermoanaerobaculaceae bacterium]